MRASYRLAAELTLDLAKNDRSCLLSTLKKTREIEKPGPQDFATA